MSAGTSSGRELFAAAIEGRPAPRPPCAPHWWGIYKYEALGLDFRRAAWQDGRALAEVYSGFYERFRPDWFHLHIGTPRWFRGCEIAGEAGGRALLRVDPALRALKRRDRYLSVDSGEDEEIVDFPDYLLASRCRRPKVDLSSVGSVDEYVKRYVWMSAEEIAEQGYTDHVVEIVRRYGREAFVAVHIPSAVCEIFDPSTGYVGFEEGLIGLVEQPEGMRRLFEGCYRAQLEWAKAYALAGAHGYAISESYISPDLAGAEVYRRFLKGIHREHFAEIGRMGITPICMFWGDVVPLLRDLTEINIRVLLVEESKKGIELDIAAIREALGGRLCLFGNLDSISLLRSGTPEEVAAEVRRQAAGAGAGFVIANGSPITPGTPAENVEAMMAAARGMGAGATGPRETPAKEEVP